MSSPTAPESWSLPELQRARRAIVVVDVVESVRLMQEDESGFIDRWRRFVNEVRTEVLPAHGGRLVKSLGDGMLLEFAGVPQAVAAALAMQRRVSALAPSAPALGSAALRLRVGIHVADVIADGLDIYGAGVNLASRIASLAGPNEIVVTAEVRDELLDNWDAEVEDLGECWLKHLSAPVRAYRLGPTGPRPAAESICATEGTTRRPTIAIASFSCDGGTDTESRIGEVLADDLTTALSHSAAWQVISRLSSSALSRRTASLADWSSHTGATFVLSGRCIVSGPALRLTAELADVRGGTVVWSDVYRATLAAVFRGDDPLLHDLVARVSTAIIDQQIDRHRQMSMPNLDSYALLVHGIGLMHRTTPHDEDRARGALTHLIERHPRAPEPRAWMAKWHVLRVAQARTESPLTEAAHARSFVSPALDMNPDHSLSLAIDGLVQAFIERDIDTAQVRYEQALRINPNESLAWLYLSSVHAHRGNGVRAEQCFEQAMRLSPMDPLGYYYNGFGAWAALAAGRHEHALVLARRSMRGNGMHLPTHVLLAQAYALCGDLQNARACGARLLALRPSMRASRYVEQFPGGPNDHARRLGIALIEAGIPR